MTPTMYSWWWWVGVMGVFRGGYGGGDGVLVVVGFRWSRRLMVATSYGGIGFGGGGCGVWQIGRL